MSADATFNIELNKDLFTQLKKLREDLNAIKGTVTKVETTSKKSFDSISKSLKNISFVNITQGIQNLNNSFQSINAPGLKFGSSLAEVSAITGVTGKQLAELGKKARASALEFGGNAADSLNTYKVILSRLGPDIAKSDVALDLMEKNVRILSKTMNGDAAAAVDALTTSMLQMGVDLSDPIAAQKAMENQMNVMAAGAKEGAAEVTQVSAAIKVSGVAMKQAKVSFEEGNAAIQALAKGGKEGSEAGMGLRNVLGKMAGEDVIPKEAVAKLKALGVNMNIVSDTSLPFTQRLRELKKAQSDATVMAQVFGVENAATANILLDSVDAQDEMLKKITGTNTAFEQAAIIMDSHEEKLSRMNAKIEDSKIAFFEATGGATAYLQPLSEIAFVISGFLPLLSGSKKAFDALRKSKVFTAAVTKTLTVVTKVFHAVMNKTPIFAIVTGVLALSAGIYALIKSTKAMNAVEKVSIDLKKRVAEKTADQRAELESLFAQLKVTKKGSEEYKTILDKIDEITPGLTKKYNLQYGALNNINAAHKEAIALIEERAKAEAAQEMLKESMTEIIKLEKEINDKKSENIELVDAYAKSYGASKKEQKEALDEMNSIWWLKQKEKELQNLNKEKDAIINIIAPKEAPKKTSNNDVASILQKKMDEGGFVSDAMKSKYGLDNKQNDVASILQKKIDEGGFVSEAMKLKYGLFNKDDKNRTTNSPIVTPGSYEANGTGTGGGKDKTYTGPDNQLKNITVNIENLVKEFVVKSSNITESSAKIKKQITEVLVASVRDFEVAM